jgi:hypothetical protein
VNDQGDVERAREELGEALDALREGLDEVLAAARGRLEDAEHAPVAEETEVTPDVGAAMWDLLRSLPGVIGNSLSGDEERVDRARETLTGLDGRLRAAGVEVDDALIGYADRLASLRDEARRG